MASGPQGPSLPGAVLPSHIYLSLSALALVKNRVRVDGFDLGHCQVPKHYVKWGVGVGGDGGGVRMEYSI